MNGNKYVLDTNALIAFFAGNQNLEWLITQPEKLIVSVISVIEYLSFSQLTQANKDLFYEFLEAADVINLSLDNNSLIEKIIFVRSAYKLKLPDAIIASTAMIYNAELITNDVAFQKIDNLKILTF